MKYELIALVPSGDVFALEHRSDGRIFSCGPIHYTEHDCDLTDFSYDEEVDAEAYALGIITQDLESELPYGDRFKIIRSSEQETQ